MSSKEQLVEETLLQNYNRYYRLAFSYVHNEPDACDIVQNGAYRAIKSSEKLLDKSYVETWVYRIMLNEIFRFVKRPSGENVSLDELREDGFDRGGDDTYEDVDLHHALEELPPEDKAIIELRYFDDMKLEDIADILEVNKSTVKSRLYRGLKKLRISLE